MEPRKVAAAGVLLAWIGLLLPWERWDSLASSGDTDRGPAVFAVILALTTALVVFRFVRPAVCVLGVTLAAIALHAALGSLTAGGLFVETDPGAGAWVAALGAAVIAAAAASRMALAIALGPIVAVVLWPRGDVFDTPASTMFFDGRTLYSGYFGSPALSEGDHLAVAVTVDDELSPVRVQVESVIVRDGALYVAVTDADRVIRITPDGTRTVLIAGPPRPRIERPPASAVVRDGFMPRALAPAPDGGLYILSGNEVLHYRAGQVTVVTSELFAPDDMTVDRDGRLYVADTGNGRVVRVERDGRLTTLLGTEARPRCVHEGGDDPLALDPRRCLGVDALAVADDGTLYVATRGVAWVLALEDGRLRVVAGSGTRGPLEQVEALAVGPGDDVYVGDTERIQRAKPYTPRAPDPSPRCRAIARWSAATLQAAAVSARDPSGLRRTIPQLESAARAVGEGEEITQLRQALERVNYDAALLESSLRGRLIMLGVHDSDLGQGCGLVGDAYALDQKTALRFCVDYQRGYDRGGIRSPERTRAVAVLPDSLRAPGAVDMLARRVCTID